MIVHEYSFDRMVAGEWWPWAGTYASEGEAVDASADEWPIRLRRRLVIFGVPLPWSRYLTIPPEATERR